jgi:predicted CoA-binding protein
VSVEKEILESCKTIAIVGLSPNESRPSNHVAVYLQSQGYRIIPVNPSAKVILGEKCYPDLLAIPDDVDVVDIFRRSEEVPQVVEDAIKIKARAIWMQEGVINREAALRAQKAGLKVVMDKCMYKEHTRIFGGTARK